MEEDRPVEPNNSGENSEGWAELCEWLDENNKELEVQCKALQDKLDRAVDWIQGHPIYHTHCNYSETGTCTCRELKHINRRKELLETLQPTEKGE